MWRRLLCCTIPRWRTFAAGGREPRPSFWTFREFGERKAAAYGAAILDALAAYGNSARAARRQEANVSPAEETLRLLAEGRGFVEIARILERRLNTVIDLVAELVERGQVNFDEKWIALERRQLIEDVFARLGAARMKTIKDTLPPEITYGEIRLLAAKFRRSPGESKQRRDPTAPGALH